MTQTLLKLAADYEDALNASVNTGGTTATLVSGTDDDSVALVAGTYGFTVDNNTPNKEYIVATISGVALTNIFHVSRQGVATTGFANFHRKGAVVEITDWAALSRVVNVLNGTTNLDGGTPLQYDTAPTLTGGTQLATVQYVLDHVNGGAVSFNAEIVNGMAGETITIGQWVYLKETDGRWYKTSAAALSTSVGLKIGKALGAGSAGGAVTGGVFLNGLETSGTYAAFTTYYLSDTAGAIATSAGTNSVKVGISDGNSKLIVGQVPDSYQDAASGSTGIPSAGNKYLTQDNAFSGSEDQVQNTQNSTTNLGTASTSGNRNKVAQSFIPSRTKIRGVKLYKSADSGSFTGTVSVAIQADSAGSPSGSDLISATVANAAWLAITAAGSFNIEFATDLTIVPGTTYWIVLSTSTADNTNHPNLGIASSSVYASGILKFNNATDGWVTTTTDLYFSTLNGVRSQIAETDSTGMLPNLLAPSSAISLDTTSVTVASSTTETTVYTKALPASALRSTSALKMQIHSFIGVRNGHTNTTRIKLNGTTIITLTASAGTSAVGCNAIINAAIFNNSSLTSQNFLATLNGTANVGNAAAANANAVGTMGTSVFGTSSVDMTGGDVTLTVTMQNDESNAGATFTYNAIILEKLTA